MSIDGYLYGEGRLILGGQVVEAQHGNYCAKQFESDMFL